MSRAIRIATFLIAGCALSTGIQAQNVYRCGDSYSQSPCSGGVTVEAHDSRTRAQQAQAATTAERERQAGNALEKTRLKEEAESARAAQRAQTGETGEASRTKPAARAAQQAGKKKEKAHKQSPYFTARTASEKQGGKKAAEQKNADPGSAPGSNNAR